MSYLFIGRIEIFIVISWNNIYFFWFAIYYIAYLLKKNMGCFILMLCAFICNITANQYMIYCSMFLAIVSKVF